MSPTTTTSPSTWTILTLWEKHLLKEEKHSEKSGGIKIDYFNVGYKSWSSHGEEHEKVGQFENMKEYVNNALANLAYAITHATQQVTHIKFQLESHSF